jgi:hypothetical protein
MCFSGGRSNYSVGRLRIWIFFHKLGRVFLTLLSSCGACAHYSVYHPTGCLLGVMLCVQVSPCDDACCRYVVVVHITPRKQPVG